MSSSSPLALVTCPVSACSVSGARNLGSVKEPVHRAVTRAMSLLSLSLSVVVLLVKVVVLVLLLVVLVVVAVLVVVEEVVVEVG